MNMSNLTVGGAVVFWQVAKNTSRAELHEGLRSLMLENYTPEPRSPLGCLRAALSDAYPEPSKDVRRVVRPIPEGFAVVVESPDEAQAGKAWGETLALATMDDGGVVSLDPYDYDKLDEIKDSMAGAAQWLPTASVSKMLIKLVEHFGGVCLRPAGGVYWLLEESLERWERVCKVVEAAASLAPGKDVEKPPATTEIVVLRVVADEQMVKAVGDRLTSEIEAEMSAIQSEVEGGELSEQTAQIAAIASLQASASYNPDRIGVLRVENRPQRDSRD